MPVHYIYLIIAIFLETIGTTALQSSQQFSKLYPSIIAVIAYAASFYFLSMALRFMPVGIVYAIWSGLGIVFITFIGWAVFRQSLDWAAIFGIGLIMTGVAVIHLLSNSSAH